MTISADIQQKFKNHVQSIGGNNIDSKDVKNGFIAIGFELDIDGQTIPLSVKYIDQKR